MTIYTIGFTKKSAEEFFELLIKNNISKVIDIRLNNASQLAGFAKGRDLKYLLPKVGSIKYSHLLDFAPTKELLDGYKNGTIPWSQYEIEYEKIISSRNALSKIDPNELTDSCFLCSEHEPEFCHRRLLAEAFKKMYPHFNIIHLQ